MKLRLLSTYKGDKKMAARNLEMNDLFRFKGKLWEVIGFKERTILVRSENEELSSLPIDSGIVVEIL